MLSDETRLRLDNLENAWFAGSASLKDAGFLLEWQEAALALLGDILFSAHQAPDRTEFINENRQELVRLVSLVREAMDQWQMLALTYGVNQDSCQAIREGLDAVAEGLGLPKRVLH